MSFVGPQHGDVLTTWSVSRDWWLFCSYGRAGRSCTVVILYSSYHLTDCWNVPESCNGTPSLMQHVDHLTHNVSTSTGALPRSVESAIALFHSCLASRRVPDNSSILDVLHFKIWCNVEPDHRTRWPGPQKTQGSTFRACLLSAHCQGWCGGTDHVRQADHPSTSRHVTKRYIDPPNIALYIAQIVGEVHPLNIISPHLSTLQ
jgi:hypothetical protein